MSEKAAVIGSSTKIDVMGNHIIEISNSPFLEKHVHGSILCEGALAFSYQQVSWHNGRKVGNYKGPPEFSIHTNQAGKKQIFQKEWISEENFKAIEQCIRRLEGLEPNLDARRIHGVGNRTQQRFGRKIEVWDTPGLCDTPHNDRFVYEQLANCVGMTLPDFKSIFFVLEPDRFSMELVKTVHIFLNANKTEDPGKKALEKLRKHCNYKQFFDSHDLIEEMVWNILTAVDTAIGKASKPYFQNKLTKEIVQTAEDFYLILVCGHGAERSHLGRDQFTRSCILYAVLSESDLLTCDTEPLRPIDKQCLPLIVFNFYTSSIYFFPKILLFNSVINGLDMIYESGSNEQFLGNKVSSVAKTYKQNEYVHLEQKEIAQRAEQDPRRAAYVSFQVKLSLYIVGCIRKWSGQTGVQPAGKTGAMSTASQQPKPGKPSVNQKENSTIIECGIMEEQGPEDMRNVVDLQSKTLENADGSLDKQHEIYFGLEDASYEGNVPSLSEEMLDKHTIAKFDQMKKNAIDTSLTFKVDEKVAARKVVENSNWNDKILKEFNPLFPIKLQYVEKKTEWIAPKKLMQKLLLAPSEESICLQYVPSSLEQSVDVHNPQATTEQSTTLPITKMEQLLPILQASPPEQTVPSQYSPVPAVSLTTTSAPSERAVLLQNKPAPSELDLLKDTEYPNVKNIRLRVAPIPPDCSYHTLKGQCQHRFELCQIKTRLRTKWLTLMDSIWLPLAELPWPRLDNIRVYYIERFDPLNMIISQIAEGKSPRPQVTMRYELLRLCTLRTYPKDNKPFMIRMAAAGFYYASDGDGVVCYCCGIRRYGWVETDDPMEVHKRINPRCKFIMNNVEYNVPAMAFGPLRKNVACLDMIPDCVLVPSQGEDVNNSQRARLGVQMSIPKHAHMAIKTVREHSFNGNWPNTPKYSPAQLADGGFFFTGIGDCVRCFYCGIGLRHWDKEDDMWVEHARWSQYCTFLIQKKGQNFVDLVQLAVEHLDDSDQASNNLYKNLVSEAAQTVLDESNYTPQQMKNAIVSILTTGKTTMVTVSELIEKVAELANQSATNKKQPEESGNAAEPPVNNSISERELSNITATDPEDIKQENEQLKEQTLCKVCLDNIVSIVFLPCGHLVTCADCAPALRKCPICRADVKGTVRTRMS